MYPPTTDAGGQPPFKYPMGLARKRIEAGGWTRQVTIRDFPLSKKMAGVEMRLIGGACASCTARRLGVGL
jgi:oxalate decarboxylase